MKKNNVKITFKVLLFTLFGYAVTASAENKNFNASSQCPAIDCDCASLPSQKWTKVCQQYETYIKKECVENSNTPKNYCSIHGERATPVALSLSVSREVSLVNAISGMEDLEVAKQSERLNEKLNATIWSLKADLASAQKMLDKQEYTRAVQTLKVLNTNLDIALEQNQIRVLALKELEELSGKELQQHSEAVWLSFAEQLNEVGMMLEEFAIKKDSQMQTATAAKDVKVSRIFSTIAYRTAGKAFEEVGYAYGQAGKHVLAANTWSRAADLSTQLSALNKNVKDEVSGASFTELQSAARMYRASYHWLKNDSEYDANLLLVRSQALVETEEQKKIQILIDGSENVPTTGSLSVR